jgi:hypothetical protein
MLSFGPISSSAQTASTNALAIALAAAVLFVLAIVIGL